MATWPTSLPAPRAADYQLAPVDPTLRTDMESGAQRMRRRTFARNDRVAVSWIFTDAQMTAFRTWFESSAEAAGGSAWFYIGLRVGATGVTTQEARFVNVWQGSYLGAGIWQVTASLEVR